MFTDHLTAAFEAELSEAMPFLTLRDGLQIPRIIGRIAFPLFAFMIAEGAGRTRSIHKYMLRLLIFAFVSEIPFDLALFHTPLNEVLHETQHQNVFFTLLLGLIAIYVFQLLQKKQLEVLSFPVLLALAYIAEDVLKTDYGAMGVICIFLFYIFLHAPGKARNIGIVFTLLILPLIISASPYTLGYSAHIDVSIYYNEYETLSILALPLILLYNGEKGKKINKYAFYGFYPGHLMVIWGLYLLFAGE